MRGGVLYHGARAERKSEDSLLQILNAASYSFNGYSVPTFLTAAAVLALGLAVLIRERDQRVSSPFALMTTTVFIWLAGFSMMYCATTPDAAIFWGRIAYVAIPLIPAAAFHFTQRFLQERRQLAHLLWGVSVAFSVLSLTSDLVVAGVQRMFWGFYPRLGPLGAVYIIYLSAVLIITVQMYLAARKKMHRQNQQRRIELFVIAFSIGLVAMLDFVASFGVPLYPFGFIAIAGFVGIIAHAIWRYSLSDINPEFAAAQILETMQGSVLVLDLNGRVRVANRAACEMLGYTEQELLSREMSALIESPLNIGRASDTLMRGGVVRDRAMIWRTRSGARVEVAVSGSMLRDDEGTPAGIVYVAIDISDRKRAEQIEYQAFHDALTGLPNRLFFRNRISFELDNPRTGLKKSAVLLLDLDGFKLVNETFGHGAGDELLQAIARRLRGTLRDRESIARLGGDEYGVLLRVNSADEATAVAQKLLETIARPFHIEGHDIYVTSSIGVAIHPDDASDVETLLRTAENGMYLAKELGKNNWQMCGPVITERSRDRLLLESSLRRALEQEQFVLHYQPIVSVQTGAVVGLEALLRWNHPTSGLISPIDFINIAEEVRLIVPIGDWVLRRACADLRRWQQSGFPDLRVAVNLSAYQFQHRDLISNVETALSDARLSPSSLQLEITETSALQSAESTVQILSALRDLGTHIAVDDFGTGYSSLSYLKRFPIDTVKLDQSFIREMTLTAGDAAIVSAVIAMAHALDLKVVAEGVETEKQLSVLREMGCEAMQGFLVSKPLPASEIDSFLRAHQAPAAADVTHATRQRLKLVKPG
jgi:diguanylate cyclase (GGDEF)-like protein/PAS domain S-box-containing protein